MWNWIQNFRQVFDATTLPSPPISENDRTTSKNIPWTGYLLRSLSQVTISQLSTWRMALLKRFVWPQLTRNQGGLRFVEKTPWIFTTKTLAKTPCQTPNDTKSLGSSFCRIRNDRVNIQNEYPWLDSSLWQWKLDTKRIKYCFICGYAILEL